jgi:hypothetical protein
LEQEKKVSDIKLINIEEIYSIYEYRKRQSIKLSFDNGVDIEKLNFIEIEFDNKKKYKVSLNAICTKMKSDVTRTFLSKVANIKYCMYHMEVQ